MKKFLCSLAALLAITSALSAGSITVFNSTGSDIKNLIIENTKKERFAMSSLPKRSGVWLSISGMRTPIVETSSQIKIYVNLKTAIDTYFINENTHSNIFNYDKNKNYILTLLPDYKASFVEE